MKQTYLEPDVQVVSIDMEMSVLTGGSNELFNPNPNPGEWESFPFSSPLF